MQILLNWINELIQIVDKSAFLSGFLSNLIVILLAGIALPSYLNFLKRPRRLEFFFLVNGTDSIALTRLPDGKYEYYFQLVLRHPGGNTLSNGLFWHLYTPSQVKMLVDDLGQGTLPRRDSQDKVVKFYGKIPGPIFGESTQELHYHFHGTFEMPDEFLNESKITLLYGFSTEFGNYPKTFRYLNKDKGVVDPKTLGQLNLNIE